MTVGVPHREVDGPQRCTVWSLSWVQPSCSPILFPSFPPLLLPFSPHSCLPASQSCGTDSSYHPWPWEPSCWSSDKVRSHFGADAGAWPPPLPSSRPVCVTGHRHGQGLLRTAPIQWSRLKDSVNPSPTRFILFHSGPQELFLAVPPCEGQVVHGPRAS